LRRSRRISGRVCRAGTSGPCLRRGLDSKRDAGEAASEIGIPKGRYIMRFVVASEVFELFPGLKLPVAVAEGIHPTTDAPGIETMWLKSWDEAARTASDYQSPQSHPRVAPWREAMSAMGVSGRKFPSSIEALLRRAFKGGEPPRINPLVDFYNAVSLRHVVPAGGFDLE
jgi:DNA/RNA-binding domain of Phe-tRNA-synthetase-like protein